MGTNGSGARGTRTARGAIATWFGRAVAAAATAYLVGVGVLTVWIRTVGEHWWATATALYLPFGIFLAPIPFFALTLFAFGFRRLLYTQLAAAWLVLFPMMGFSVPWPMFPSRDAPKFRLLSFNVDSGREGFDKVVGQVLKFHPDVAVFQEVLANSSTLVALLRTHYPVVEASNQFVIASRFPIAETQTPPRIPFYGRSHSPRYLRHVLRTPLGRIVLYVVHPLSPRGGFYALRGHGLRREILSGRFFAAANAEALRESSGLREQQVRAFAADADRETEPVVIAGDTNLPTVSPLVRRYLGRYQDGFSMAGFGFGYTFPARHPWMRIDRIFATRELRFSGFSVGCPGASDHLCVVADLERHSR